MKGFYIKINSKIVQIPYENTIIMIKQRFDKFNINAHSSFQDSNETKFIYWIDSDICINDTIHIQIKDLNEFSEPIRIENPFESEKEMSEEDYKEALDEDLKTYFILQNLLKEKGLRL